MTACEHEYEMIGNVVLTCNPPIYCDQYRCHKCGDNRGIQHPRSWPEKIYKSSSELDKLEFGTPQQTETKE